MIKSFDCKTVTLLPSVCVVFQKPTNERIVEKIIWSILKHSKFNPFSFKPWIRPLEAHDVKPRVGSISKKPTV